MFIPNKCTFRKLIQSIAASCTGSYETETVSNKIEDIKSKVKSISKSNPLIDFEIENLFDQRWANLEPVYENVALKCRIEELIHFCEEFKEEEE